MRWGVGRAGRLFFFLRGDVADARPRAPLLSSLFSHLSAAHRPATADVQPHPGVAPATTRKAGPAPGAAGGREGAPLAVVRRGGGGICVALSFVEQRGVSLSVGDGTPLRVSAGRRAGRHRAWAVRVCVCVRVPVRWDAACAKGKNEGAERREKKKSTRCRLPPLSPLPSPRFGILHRAGGGGPHAQRPRTHTHTHIDHRD